MDLQLVHSLFRDRVVSAFCIVLLGLVLSGGAAWGEELDLNDLIQEAMKGNHDILVIEARIMASEYKVPQATSLPDPMFIFGYQNEGFDRYTYGEMEGAQWMFSASQMIPFPGKRALRGEMARGAGKADEMKGEMRGEEPEAGRGEEGGKEPPVSPEKGEEKRPPGTQKTLFDGFRDR